VEWDCQLELFFELVNKANDHLRFDTLRASDRNAQGSGAARGGDPRKARRPCPVSFSVRVQNRS
jgi:hypothetical protein